MNHIKNVTLSAKSRLILGENMAVFLREGHKSCPPSSGVKKNPVEEAARGTEQHVSYQINTIGHGLFTTFDMYER